VLSVVPILFHYWAEAADALETSKFFNDFIAGVVNQSPKRFVGLGTVPLQDPDLAIKELERCVKTLGLPGVEIGSHVNDMNLSDVELFPFFEAAQDLEASIFVHPWDMMGMDTMRRYWLPWLVGMPAETSLAICSLIFSGVFERLPRLKTAFAHGGGSFPATVSRVEHAFHVRPDLCAIDNNVHPKAYLGRFWLDSLVHDERMLRYLIDLVGPDRVALGSDYPFPLGELEPGKLIKSMDLSKNTKEMLLNGSALEWLGLDKKRFL